MFKIIFLALQVPSVSKAIAKTKIKKMPEAEIMQNLEDDEMEEESAAQRVERFNFFIDECELEQDALDNPM